MSYTVPMKDTERTPTRRSGAWRAEAIYTALQALQALGSDHQWHTRNELATYLAKRGLNRSERAALDRLAAAGRIERRIVASPHSEFNQRLEYRMIKEGTNTKGVNAMGANST